MGIPVVATDLAEIRRFNAGQGDVVAVAADASGFVSAVRAALGPASAGTVERRIAVAHANSWQRRIAAMKRLIVEGIERRAAGAQRWEDKLRRGLRRTRTRLAQGVLRPAALHPPVLNTHPRRGRAGPLAV